MPPKDRLEAHQILVDSKNRAKIVYDHPIKIRFTSQVSDTLPWSFKPVQREMVVLPGEKALAFYVATNHATEPLVGVATYNVVPDLAGAYFNKIQCFCFDEQRLNPGETVNMPIHFFVDPSIEDDKILRGIHEITLSYTFFLAEDQSSEWWEEEREKHAKPTSL
jgi:cytochrome c oxidase assembly protein subunit 11